MALKAVHDKVDDIPEEFRSLYTEKAGKWELTGIEGVKTQADVDRVQTSLVKERNEHKATKDKLTAWGELKPDEVVTKLDRITELEAAAKGKIDETKLEEMANRRAEAIVKSKLSPVERSLVQTQKERDELKEKVGGFEGRERTRTVHDSVRKALVAQKVLSEAQEDALLLAERVFEVSEDGRVVTKDGVGVTAGLDPTAWLTDMQAKRPHWWPSSQGGGARGSGAGGGPGGGANPWSFEGWNMTAQGAYLRANGAEKAAAMAKAAGTTVGGPKPAAKKAG